MVAGDRDNQRGGGQRFRASECVDAANAGFGGDEHLQDGREW